MLQSQTRDLPYFPSVPSHHPGHTSPRLLGHCFGGNARTYMLATVNPTAEQARETLFTLNYAQTAKLITNTPVINRLKYRRPIGVHGTGRAGRSKSSRRGFEKTERHAKEKSSLSLSIAYFRLKFFEECCHLTQKQPTMTNKLGRAAWHKCKYCQPSNAFINGIRHHFITSSDILLKIVYDDLNILRYSIRPVSCFFPKLKRPHCEIIPRRTGKDLLWCFH